MGERVRGQIMTKSQIFGLLLQGRSKKGMSDEIEDLPLESYLIFI